VRIEKKMRQLPNLLTVLRVVMIAPFLWLLFQDNATFRFLALLLFIIASITDFLDGHLARRFNLVSQFGKFMDPVADKLLTGSAMIGFALLSPIKLSGWLVAFILFREIAVSVWRSFMLKRGMVIAAASWGKIKTTCQIVVLIFGLLILWLDAWKNSFLPEWD